MSEQTTIDDGGAAFPHGDQYDPHDHPGMSLRDWFAGQIAGGMCRVMACSSKKQVAVKEMAEAEGRSMHKHIAKCAYHLADAMLAARKEQP